MSEVIRVLIADDHAVVREGLRALLATEQDMALVGEAPDGEAAVHLAVTTRPDVILLDLLMPRLDGVAAIQQIRAANPAARVLVLTSFAEDEQVFPAIRSGALGFLLKDTSPGELLQAIRDVHQGEAVLSPPVARRVIQELNRPAATTPAGDALTEREMEVLKLVAGGLSNQEIAARLVISERTVRNHVGAILAKLNLSNRTQAALYAMKNGLIQ